MEIKLTEKDKKRIFDADDVYSIMQRILLRDNKIDREKEHFWMIGMNVAGYILYIELVTLGTVRRAPIEPMNIYRVAVMKNAARVIGVHNHPSGVMIPSEADKDVTDKLIQVGKILDIQMEDHLIISPTNYVSFKAMGLMEELEKSLKYVPTYMIVDQIRREEKKIAKDAVKAEREKREKLELATVTALVEKGIPVDSIAKIMGVTQKVVENIIKRKIDNTK